MTKISTRGAETNHGGDSLRPRGHFGHRGDPYDQNCDPLAVWTNHGGDPLWPFWT